LKFGWIEGKIRVGTDRETRDHRRERAGPRTWITEGRGGGKLQASQVKRCGDQSPTSKKNSSRDPQAMARASSSPWPCLPLLQLAIAAVFVALPVAACAGSSNDAGNGAGSGRKRVFETKKELLGQEGAPSQRRAGFTVGRTPPHSLALRHAQIMNRYAVPPPATRYPPATELR
jgi:hypothetical protein